MPALRSRFLVLLFVLLLPAPRSTADDWWGWTSLEIWKRDRARAWLLLGNQLDLQDSPSVQILSPRPFQDPRRISPERLAVKRPNCPTRGHTDFLATNQVFDSRAFAAHFNPHGVAPDWILAAPLEHVTGRNPAHQLRAKRLEGSAVAP